MLTSFPLSAWDFSYPFLLGVHKDRAGGFRGRMDVRYGTMVEYSVHRLGYLDDRAGLQAIGDGQWAE